MTKTRMGSRTAGNKPLPSPASTYFRINRNQERIYVPLGSEIARGGEGAIYPVENDTGYIAKIFLKDALIRSAKIEAMVRNPPRHLPYFGNAPIRIAWPIASLFRLDQHQQPQRVGFIMAYVNMRQSVPLLKLYNVRDRIQTYPQFTWRNLLQTAHNLADIVADLHARGYVIGDLNESNILVSQDADVTVIDCDSMQVYDRQSQRLFKCLVGKAEYLPPELQGRDLRGVERRNVQEDSFGLAVLIYLLLMGGGHPYAGVWHGQGEPPSIGMRIKEGVFPHQRNVLMTPAPGTLPFNTLPRRVRHLMWRTFVSGARHPDQRPLALDWVQALRAAQRPWNLHNCRVHPRRHQYAFPWWRVLSPPPCPWCAREARGINDFPNEPTQSPNHLRRTLLWFMAILALIVGGVYFIQHYEAILHILFRFASKAPPKKSH